MEKEKIEVRKIIRKLYKELIEIADQNSPELYIMSKQEHVFIIKELQKLERELERSRKSRDNWRHRAEKAEKRLKDGI